jgi:hypothetical protein
VRMAQSGLLRPRGQALRRGGLSGKMALSGAADLASNDRKWRPSTLSAATR